MQQGETDCQQRDKLVEIIGKGAVQEIVENFTGNSQPPGDGEPQHQVGSQPGGAGDIPHYLLAAGGKQTVEETGRLA